MSQIIHYSLHPSSRLHRRMLLTAEIVDSDHEHHHARLQRANLPILQAPEQMLCRIPANAKIGRPQMPKILVPRLRPRLALGQGIAEE